MDVFLLCSEEKVEYLETIKKHIKLQYNKNVIIQNYLEVKEFKNTLYLLYLQDNEIKILFNLLFDTQTRFAILPNETSTLAMKSYGVSKDLYEAIDDAFNSARYTKIDLLKCNGELVFNSVVIGNVHGLNDSIEKQSFVSRFIHFFKNLKELKLQDFTLSTSKEHEIRTAASGIMVLENNLVSKSDGVINDTFYFNDGKLNAFILAPKSIISYLYYLLLTFFYAHFKIRTLPQSVSVVKTSSLTISSSQTINFKQDGVYLNSKTLEFETLKQALNVALGRKIENIEDFQQEAQEVKDVIRTKDLPLGEVKRMLVSKSIPLFPKAEESEFKELFLSLKESAKLSSTFIVLMALSTLLATTGLFQNSSPVIIGAMILAPLMAPIVSLSMGVVRGEAELLSNSFKTLFYGIITALFFSVVLTYFLPLATLTDEMRGRLNPNILDLMVAVVSGIAGAYASAKSEIAKSLAGVAIAVALVPPLSVTGIGLAWGDFSMVYGSFLLFITNLVGITLAASLTFLVLGYSAVQRAKKGIVYSSIAMALITIPLILSFNKALEQSDIYELLNNKSIELESKKLYVKVTQVDLNADILVLYLDTYSDDALQKKDLQQLKQEIVSMLQRSVRLKIQSNILVD